MSPFLSARLERRLVVLIALHSYAVGAFLLLLPEWSAGLGGFERVVPTFFARQAGVLHFLVATAYLLEYFHRRSVTLLVFAKSSAAVFLLAMTLLEPGVWIIPASGVADGLMGLAVLVVHRRPPGARRA